MAPHHPLLTHINKFLSVHWDKLSPLVVACSGGPDSKALLYLLLRCPGLKLHVAHLDHGWREESEREAKELQCEVENLGLPFHLKRLEKCEKSENEARKARYAFLEQVREEVGAQALLLGHQMEDQAETVLKRIFEGASLTACQGMRPVSGRLWRPLLIVPKQTLIDFLEQEGILFVQDETNLSSRYLRGRMRKNIFPWLEEAFGKSVVKNLCRLGERAARLEEALNQQVEGIHGDSNILLTDLAPLNEVALEYFLKRWTERRGIGLSLDQLTLLVRMVRIGDCQKRVTTSSHEFRVEEGKLALKKICDYREVGSQAT